MELKHGEMVWVPSDYYTVGSESVGFGDPIRCRVVGLNSNKVTVIVKNRDRLEPKSARKQYPLSLVAKTKGCLDDRTK